MELRWVLAAAVAIVGTSSAAQAEEQVVREPDREVVLKKTVVDFSAASVEGELAQPVGDYLYSQPKKSFASMIQHRKSFDAELRDSAEH